MSLQNISLTTPEWNLMECLWEASPRTGREAAEFLMNHVGWSRSTTLTMLRRTALLLFIQPAQDFRKQLRLRRAVLRTGRLGSILSHSFSLPESALAGAPRVILIGRGTRRTPAAARSRRPCR